MQFFIHCNFFCQEYKFTLLFTLLSEGVFVSCLNSLWLDLVVNSHAFNKEREWPDKLFILLY